MKIHPRFRQILVPLTFVAAAALLPAAAVLADRDDHVDARALLQRGEILPLGSILDTVQHRVPGDVIEIELEREKSGWEYEVKVLTPSGQVRKITLNAGSGAIIKIKDD